MTDMTAELDAWDAAAKLDPDRRLVFALRVFAKTALDMTGMSDAEREEVGSGVEAVADAIERTFRLRA
jgi:hypothetical protein